MSLTVWLVIVFLIGVNAFYVAAEFSTVGIRRSRVMQLAQEGNWMAKRLVPIIQDPAKLDRYVAACQIGITVSSLVLGAYAQSRLAAVLGPLIGELGGMGAAAAQSTAALVVLAALTIAQVIFGELLPKSLALQFPTQFALFVVLPMQWSKRLFGPFIWLLNGSGNLVLRLLRVPRSAHRHIHSADEIDLLLVESRDGGSLEAEEHERLHRAIQLSVRSASDLMVPRERLAMLDADRPFEDLVAEVVASPYTRLPVYRGTRDRVIGILHTRDLATLVSRGRPALSLKGLLRPVVTVPGHLPCDDLLGAMRDQRTHQVIVQDADGRVIGLVALEDVLADMLGELADELKGESGVKTEESARG